MTLALNIMTLLLVLVHAGLLAYAVINGRTHSTTQSSAFNWLLALLTLAIFTALSQLLPADVPGLGRDAFVWLGILSIMLTYGLFVLQDALPDDAMLRLRWLALGAVWLLLYIVAVLTGGIIGWSAWSEQGVSLAGLAALLGLILVGLLLIGVISYRFYVTPMPELGNRAAFWAITLLVLLVGMLLLGSGIQQLMLSGDLLLLVALASAVYAHHNHRLFDVRQAIALSIRTLTLAVATWSLTFAGLYITDRLDLAEQTTGLLLLAAAALLIAVLLIPVRQFIEQMYRLLQRRGRVSLSAAVTRYNQRVSLATSVEEVVSTTAETLNDVMGLRRSALMIVNNVREQPDQIELIVLQRDDSLSAPSHRGLIPKSSVLFELLALSRLPFGQYDIEYNPALTSLTASEREFFQEINFSAYAPIVVENRLIAVLAGGAKLDGSAYSAEDAEMLMLIAQQVGTALRSTRLINDLQVLNDNMRVLNKNLENAKLELQKLDSIKTDFITIASHELRTPLAQIRGYTDIIDSLNQQGMLQQQQTQQMVAKLRHSTERMEELISAMLDVSQIDVNSMDLRFMQANPETIVKLAIDPLREAFSQRNLTLDTRDLAGLPHLQADMQRLVQAFRNLIVNAIKFTPDGGTITVYGSFEKPADSDMDYVVFSIQDTGVGIAAKDLEYIFQKFYRGFDTQLHSTGLYKFMGAGPGLGLTIAKGIIEGHGGQIWAESSGHDMEALPGSTFYIRLPIVPPEGARRVMPFEGETENSSAATLTETT